MGCNSSKNTDAIIPIRLNSDGSEMGDSQEEREMAFVKTWDANPLPAIPTSTKASVTNSDNTDIFGTEERFQVNKNGAAFTVTVEGAPIGCSNPPRRLKPLGDGRRCRMMTREEQLRREEEHHRRREEKLKEKTEKLSHKKIKEKKQIVERKQFQEAQKIFAQSEARIHHVSKNRDRALRSKVQKVRVHNAKIAEDVHENSLNAKWRNEMENDAEYNRSEGKNGADSWEDSEELKKIYDKMDFIRPNETTAGQIVACGGVSDDEFFG